MQVTFVNKVSYLCLCVHACAHAFSELFGFQTYRKETCCRRGKKEILPTKINKLVFTFTQWKLKNNDKPKHPKYTQHYSICIKFLNTITKKVAYIKFVIYIYIYKILYLYNVDAIREGHSAHRMNNFLTRMVGTWMFIYLYLTTQETWVQSLGQEDPLEKEMATHSSILAWRIPWTEEPGGLQSMGSQRVKHDCATSLYLV